MSDTIAANGACLCGAITVDAPHMDKHLGACHCEMCRTWASGPLMAVDCGTNVSFTGQTHLRTYASSEWAERGFCEKCGTHLFYRLKESKQYFMCAGIFKQQDEMVFDHQIFVEEKPSHYDFANQTKMMTGAEVFASFGSQDT